MTRINQDIRETEYYDRRSGKDRRTTGDLSQQCTEQRCNVDRRKGIPRRKHKRFPVKTFTFVKLWSDCDEDIGQLLDISSQGLSLRYLATGREPRNFTRLSILLPGNIFAVAAIPFRTVSDTELTNGSPSGSIVFRRSGVQFEDLTPYQAFELNYFLDHHIGG